MLHMSMYVMIYAGYVVKWFEMFKRKKNKWLSWI